MLPVISLLIIEYIFNFFLCLFTLYVSELYLIAVRKFLTDCAQLLRATIICATFRVNQLNMQVEEMNTELRSYSDQVKLLTTSENNLRLEVLI